MYSYYQISQLVAERRRELQAEQRQAQAVALAKSSRRAQRASGRRVRLAVRKALWLRSEPQRITPAGVPRAALGDTGRQPDLAGP